MKGLVAGKYELCGLIRRGGMGSVWEARHALLGTRFAIKFIDAEHAGHAGARARFDSEARAAASIDSKHAAQIFDYGVTDEGHPYIVMELLVGESLEARLERCRTLPLEEIARIISQVCRALQRAHDAGIVHRDLKPSNVFLARVPDEECEIAKVLDFGIAKIVQSGIEASVASSTETGAMLGTPSYMSPEQVRASRSVDHRTDLWSLGVVAFRCATGVHPFEADTVGDLLVRICTDTPPTPSSLVPTLPRSFDAWFDCAVHREPSRRFSSARELADELTFAAGRGSRRTATAAFADTVHSSRRGDVRAAPPSSSPPISTKPSHAEEPGSSRRPPGTALGMKGAAINSTVAWVRDTLGEDVLRQAFASMPSEAARTYREALAFSWVPIAVQDAFMRSLVATAWPHDRASAVRAMRRLGEYVAEDNLSTLYKVVLALTSPDGLLSRLPRLWATYFTGAEMTRVDVGDRSASFAVRHVGYYMLGAHAAGWMQFAYRKVGSRNPEVSCSQLEQHIDDARDLDFTVRW